MNPVSNFCIPVFILPVQGEVLLRGRGVGEALNGFYGSFKQEFEEQKEIYPCETPEV